VTRVRLVLVAALLVSGCQSAGRTPVEQAKAINERHRDRFGNADLPRKIGFVENVGLQIPVLSPDGGQLLYLRTDQGYLSPMTLLGSPEPEHTPAAGTLSIWLRPAEGEATGERLSAHRWAHSPVWADSGRAVAYVVNEPPISFIVHHDLGTEEETVLGLPDAVNCLPRFDGNDQTLLFCAGPSTDGPFRVYRQAVAEATPTPLTPAGADCLLPVFSDGAAAVLCAQTEAEHLNWVRCGPRGTTEVAPQWSTPARPDLIQTWAGITAPLSPQRDALLFYDTARDRVCVLHVPERTVRRHRRGSIAACWIGDDAIALATPDGAFVVNATTGASVSIFNGRWIPSRFVPPENRLILLGYENPHRFAIWEVVFKPRRNAE
jgi:hypothetical protein